MIPDFLIIRAGALAENPRLLLLDELTTFLDVEVSALGYSGLIFPDDV